jgi:hypothetical protein
MHLLHEVVHDGLGHHINQRLLDNVVVRVDEKF